MLCSHPNGHATLSQQKQTTHAGWTSVASRAGAVQVRCYSAPRTGFIPVVVLLRGANGFGSFSLHYEGYAQPL